jgi:Ca2+/Na+ antiporter
MKKIFYILLIAVLVIIAVYFLFFGKKEQETNQPLTETSEESEQIQPEEAVYALSEEDIDKLINQPIKPPKEMSERGGGFKVASAPGFYPKFSSGWIDPKKPKLGEEQYLSLDMTDPSGIKNIVVEIKDENGKMVIDKFNLELVEGDKKQGTWANKWQVHDVGRVFRADFTAENVNGKTDILTYFIIQG